MSPNLESLVSMLENHDHDRIVNLENSVKAILALLTEGAAEHENERVVKVIIAALSRK